MPRYRILGFTKGLDLAVKRHAPVQQQVGLLQAMSRARTCSWHVGSQGQPREQESTKRAEEDEVHEEDRGWTGLGTQGQRVCVLVTMGNHCRFLRKQAIMTKEGPENSFWERCAEELEREEMGG